MMDPAFTFDAHLPGTEIALWGDVKAMVSSTCVNIDGSVEYRVAWWDGRTLRQEWVQAGFVLGDHKDERRIGFLRPGDE